MDTTPGRRPQEIGGSAESNTLASNICGPTQGEEFAVVVTHVERANLRIVIDRIRRQFAAEKFTFTGRTLTVTASFDISVFHVFGDEESPGGLRYYDRSMLHYMRPNTEAASVQSSQSMTQRSLQQMSQALLRNQNRVSNEIAYVHIRDMVTRWVALGRMVSPNCIYGQAYGKQ